MSHCLGNTKLECNGGFRAQLHMLTCIRNGKQTSCWLNCRGFHALKAEFLQFGLFYLGSGRHYTPLGQNGILQTSHGLLVYTIHLSLVISQLFVSYGRRANLNFSSRPHFIRSEYFEIWN